MVAELVAEWLAEVEEGGGEERSEVCWVVCETQIEQESGCGQF